MFSYCHLKPRKGILFGIQKNSLVASVPMPKIELTHNNIMRVRLLAGDKQKVFTQADAKGLQLLVRWKGQSLTSTKVTRDNNRDVYHFFWFYRYTLPQTKKRNTVKIGDWPNLSAADAILKVRMLNAIVANGEDPRILIKEEKADEVDIRKGLGLNVPSEYRFENVIEALDDFWPATGKDPETMRKYKVSLNGYAMPKFAGMDIRRITGVEWDELVLTLANVDKKPGAASNLHKAGRRLMSFAHERGLITFNPLLQRKDAVNATRLAPHDRYLDSNEVHKFMGGIDEQQIEEWAKVLLKLMLFESVRVEEWARVRIGWIKFEDMRIEHPAETMKNRKAAWTYTPDPVIEILISWLKVLKARYGKLSPDFYLFPGDSPTEPQKAHPSDETGKIGGWISFSPKVLRKTISTHLQRQGCPPTVLRAIRNQKVTEGVEEHYDFDDLYHMKKEWIDKWAKLLLKAKESPECLHTDRDSKLSSELSSAVSGLFD